MAQIKWVSDPAHSEISFKVKHLMISTITGYFRKFYLELTTEDDDFETAANIIFTVEVESIDTRNEQRDNHLKSGEFFNREEYPQIKFTGTSFHKEEGESTLKGRLSIKGITHDVKVKVEFGGIAVDMYGQTKAGIQIKGKIGREDFGLAWNAVTEAGNIVVSDKVKYNGAIELIKQI